ncbi:MAG TPA: NAD(P)-dependent oxidoreductase [Phycisphaerales bacterium]|nr:NAD(P)-dependent oxidoreductase [Phycisphaerales bacterium]
MIADSFEASGIEAIRSLGCQVIHEPKAGAEGLPDALRQASPDILIVRSSKVTPDAIKSAKGLKLIIRAGAGYDNIDVPTASAAGIPVSNCPGMNAVAVAELTMGLLIALDRRLCEQNAAMLAGQWNKKEFSKARGLKGMTLGIVGCGAIGRAVMKRALAFEMNVLAWSRSITREHARDLGAQWAGTDTPALWDMASRCDAVSIHLPSAPDTRQLIGREFISRMKPGAYLINTSRGNVIDEEALLAASREKNLRYGLDVYENAPAQTQAPWNCRLAQADAGIVRVLTHHVGASTDQAQRAVADETVRIVRVFMESGRAENCVNAAAVS